LRLSTASRGRRSAPGACRSGRGSRSRRESGSGRQLARPSGSRPRPVRWATGQADQPRSPPTAAVEASENWRHRHEAAALLDLLDDLFGVGQTCCWVSSVADRKFRRCGIPRCPSTLEAAPSSRALRRPRC
jgi:hypothetical protein